MAGQPAAIRLVGGAAFAFGYFDRRATLDIVAVYHPDDLVERVAAEIAAERGLPADWLNDHALGFVPFVGQDEWTELFTEGPITVFVASAPMLLAMKLAANRGLRDSGDIEGLLRTCGVTSVERAQAIYETYHAQGVLSSSAQARVRALLDQEDQQAAAGDWRLAIGADRRVAGPSMCPANSDQLATSRVRYPVRGPRSGSTSPRGITTGRMRPFRPTMTRAVPPLRPR